MTATTSQIRTLRAEAITAGDYRQAAICTLALNGVIDAGDDDAGSLEARQVEAEGMTQEQALAECAAVIADASAQDDE